MDETRYLSAAEVAQRLGVSLRTIRRRIADGTLTSVKIGGAVRIPVAALEPASAGVTAAREVAAPYGTERESREDYIRRWNRDHWPDSWEMFLGRRRQAFAELEALAKLTNPPTGPHDTVDALLEQEREEFGMRLMQFIPERKEPEA